ncbi:MAG: anti-anti-sigma regulatory factor [Pseudomonadota bacterium]|jgi:anti-anti-sigma factor
MSTPFSFTVTGRIDAASAPQVERDLLAAIEQSGPHLIIELSQLSYMSSAGLRVMLVAAKRARADGGKAVIQAAQPAVAEVLRMSGFDRVIPLAPNEDAARAHFGQ